MGNPFKPTFGATPLFLAGRTGLLEEFVDSLDNGPGSPGRATIYTGARGTGKTVMLNEAEDLARKRGWIVVSETATPGFLSRLVQEHLPRVLQNLLPAQAKHEVTSITLPLGLGGASRDRLLETAGRPDTFRGLATRICDLLAKQQTGLLVSLDELHQNQLPELREFALSVQHLFRENREFVFLAAGLPVSVNSIINDDLLTFLRRSDRHSLGRIPEAEVADAIQSTFEQSERSISMDQAVEAAKATVGYPYLVQLVGFHVWKQNRSNPEVSDDDVTVGIDAARRRLGSVVHEAAIADLSEIDRTFLLAMAQDDGPSKMSDLAGRLTVDTNYASQYRLRLIANELIESVGHGMVDFSLPYLRDYLRDHPALEAQQLAPDRKDVQP